MNTSREELVKEFTELRNARMTKGNCSRTRNIYFDWLNDTDKLAESKTEEELQKDIQRMKR